MKFFRFLLTVAVLSLPAAWLQADLIPASRLVNWTPGTSVGVPGGIPTNRTHLIDVTQAPYNADKTGVNDCHDAIANAISAANSGDVVYLPAGTYKVASRIYTGKSNYTIRGAGDSTVINSACSSNSLFLLGPAADWDTAVAITSGFTKGSTVLGVADTSVFAVNALVRISEENDSALPVASPHNGPNARARGQTSIVSSVNSGNGTITISPGLHWALSSGLSPKAAPMAGNLVATGIGIEDLKINAIGGTEGFTIFFENVTNCWVKNVHIIGSYCYSLYFLACCHCEVRHSNFEQLNHAGPNGSLTIFEQMSASLIEDNIVYKGSTHFEFNYSCSGNVVAYNFFEDSTISTMVGVSIDSNHGPHNSYNLYEGNIAPMFECDGYFGGASEDTVARNWLHGTSPGADNRYPILLKRFTRNYNVVGNILGKTGQSYPGIYQFGWPFIGNDSTFVGTASLINSSPWSNWAAYLAGTTFDPNTSFEEKDLDVQATLILKGNWNSVDGAIPSGESLGTDTLPNSYYRSIKPAWFGTLTWPAFDPTNPGTPAYDSIPAGYRYVHGTEAPGIVTAQAPSNARTAISTPY